MSLENDVLTWIRETSQMVRHGDDIALFELRKTRQYGSDGFQYRDETNKQLCTPRYRNKIKASYSPS